LVAAANSQLRAVSCSTVERNPTDRIDPLLEIVGLVRAALARRVANLYKSTCGMQHSTRRAPRGRLFLLRNEM